MPATSCTARACATTDKIHAGAVFCKHSFLPILFTSYHPSCRVINHGGKGAVASCQQRAQWIENGKNCYKIQFQDAVWVEHVFQMLEFRTGSVAKKPGLSCVHLGIKDPANDSYSYPSFTKNLALQRHDLDSRAHYSICGEVKGTKWLRLQ